MKILYQIPSRHCWELSELSASLSSDLYRNDVKTQSDDSCLYDTSKHLEGTAASLLRRSIDDAFIHEIATRN